MKGILFALALIGCTERSPSTSRWLAQLRPLGLMARPLVIVTIDYEKSPEPGVLPGGALQLPKAWRDRWWSPTVLARVAHLVRHVDVGLPVVERVGGCDAWRAIMLTHELDGLALEARVLAAHGRPVDPRSFGPALAARMDAYAARCVREPRASPGDRKAP